MSNKLLFFAIIVSVSANSLNCPCSQSNGQTQEPDKILGHQEDQVTEKHRKKCCPYNFNGKLCRTVGDRILCGYDKNVERPGGNNNNIDLQNGCRIKNGRLECGYYQPPYTYSPRPPVKDANSNPAKDYLTTSAGGKILAGTETVKPPGSPIQNNEIVEGPPC